jgi:hypothetical protein
MSALVVDTHAAVWYLLNEVTIPIAVNTGNI